jgi:hypothetical protein
MTTTDSVARVNAAKALREELQGMGALNGDVAQGLAKWTDLTSGRRPGYYAAHCKVVDEFREAHGMEKIERPGQSKPAPEPVAPVVDEAAFEAAAPVAQKDAAAKVAKTAKAAKTARADKDAALVLTPKGIKPAKGAKAAPAKPAKVAVEKVPARKVETVKNAPGQFLRQRRLVRRTKTVVSIWDLSHADAAAKFGPVVIPGTETPAKYLVIDEDHGQQIGVKNYEAAWRIALDPAQFCTACPKA